MIPDGQTQAAGQPAADDSGDGAGEPEGVSVLAGASSNVIERTSASSDVSDGVNALGEAALRVAVLSVSIRHPSLEDAVRGLRR